MSSASNHATEARSQEARNEDVSRLMPGVSCLLQVTDSVAGFLSKAPCC